MLEAIYYPSYVPDINWYKTQLLLWDSIYRIVPYSVENDFGAGRLSSLWNIPENYLRTVSFGMPDEQYFEDRKYAIVQQLKKLSEEKNDNYHNEEHFYLNTDKVPRWIGDTLLELGLRKKAKKYKWGAKHYLVLAAIKRIPKMAMVVLKEDSFLY